MFQKSLLKDSSFVDGPKYKDFFNGSKLLSYPGNKVHFKGFYGDVTSVSNVVDNMVLLTFLCLIYFLTMWQLFIDNHFEVFGNKDEPQPQQHTAAHAELCSEN